MNSYRVKLLVAFVAGACLAGAVQAAPITKAVQAACKTDYKNYCGEYGLETTSRQARSAKQKWNGGTALAARPHRCRLSASLSSLPFAGRDDLCLLTHRANERRLRPGRAPRRRGR